MNEVQAGQLWESEDPREHNQFEITRVFGDTAWYQNINTGRHGRIRIARLRHCGKRGYRLLEEAPW